MARLTDSNGVLLGGLSRSSEEALAMTRDAAAAGDYIPRADTPRRKHGPDETVVGLECSYGSRAYSYASAPDQNPSISQSARRAGCHNPVETPDERHHCEVCGGDYCAVHSEPAAHDCRHIIRHA